MVEARESILTAACEASPRDRRNQKKLNGILLTWVATWLAVTAVVAFDLLPTGTPAIAATLIPAVLGAWSLFAYRRFLLEADELRRKIELDSLAVAFGVGVVGGMTYWLLQLAAPLPEMDFLFLITAMLFTHGIGVFVGRQRYS